MESCGKRDWGRRGQREREALWVVEEGKAVGGESRERNRNRAVKGERCRRREEREEESHRRVKGRSETHEAGVYWW